MMRGEPSVLLADLVALLHLAFLGFVVVGGLLAVRWPVLLWAHVPCAAYAFLIVIVGWSCPLTGVERSLRTRAGEPVYAGGFVDHYLTGVLYPERHEQAVQLGIAVLVLASYAALAFRCGRAVRA